MTYEPRLAGLHNDDGRPNVDSPAAEVLPCTIGFRFAHYEALHLQAALFGLAQSCYSGYLLHRHYSDYFITTTCILIFFRA
jgi:hypothetical protein